MTSPSASDSGNPQGEIRDAIFAMARRLEKSSDLPQAGIADLKTAVDDLRIRLWGMLVAGDAGEYQGFAGRFRMRRAAECCSGIEQELANGRLRADSAESQMLHVASRNLVVRLDSTAARP